MTMTIPRLGGIVLLGVALTSTTAWAGAGPAGHSHHHGHGASFSAGKPGDPRKPARVIEVRMAEGDGKMLFVPDRLEIRKGEQVRFVLRNDGALEHEFVLASTADNLAHAEAMKKAPEMAHDEPNAKRLAPGKTGEIVWRFTRAGRFEYGCLIPGHREAGMTGAVVVK
jgi:uncharacterized cupredoxin-like copper-binding protein